MVVVAEHGFEQVRHDTFAVASRTGDTIELLPPIASIETRCDDLEEVVFGLLVLKQPIQECLDLLADVWIGLLGIRISTSGAYIVQWREHPEDTSVEVKNAVRKGIEITVHIYLRLQVLKLIEGR